ncbi:hypothetical protein QWJ41_02580 [Nocardioides sp. SOB44]|uniref:DUF3558 domain-containing protein n=1 Tax=Nocardioides cremeus TaxID=3058044 RepID=A0ABT8TKV2_9ACTN|nr:hypothetical protein [Nocardioides cremeus]MDO3394597.1 hypothetical protein [Nocardioides cremeus]
MSLPTSRLAATGAAVVLALLLGGCGGGDDATPVAEEPPPTGSSPSEPSPDEPTGAPGRPCPRVLPTAGERAGADEAAEELPELPPVRRAWVCRYHPAQLGEGEGEGDGDGDGDGEGSPSGWERQGRAAPVADADLAPLADALDGLALLDLDTSQRVCTADLGPRFMVVLADAGDLTGVVVDDFGCHDTRLTADPRSRPAGADGPGGAVDGVLQGGPRVLEALGVGRGA